MRVLIAQIVVRRAGVPVRRERRIEVDRLSIGRGPDNDIALPGLGISLYHATIASDGRELTLSCLEAARVEVNDRNQTQAKLRPGDVVRVGPHELRLLAPSDDVDLFIEVWQKDSHRDERVDLDSRTQLGVGSGILTKRRMSWAAVGLVFVVFVVVPLSIGLLGESWSSGTVARKHAFIADDCGSCHATPFQRVANAQCIECHADVGHHTSERERPDALVDFRCAACHPDHKGEAGLTSLGSKLCADCHGRIAEVSPGSDLGAVTDFGTDHPEFRYRVVARAVEELKRVGRGSELVEHSGVHFNHYRHVGKRVSLPEGGHGNLKCDRCHQLDTSGRYMKPVDYEPHCRSCHPLTFDADLGDVEALHGDPGAMRAGLRAIYAEHALKGRVDDPRAPAEVRFMRPGRTLSSKESDVVSRWVDEKVLQAESHLMEEPGECGRCHELVPGASDLGIDVAEVEITSVWLPTTEFSHGTHAPFRCRACHPAASVYDPDDAPGEPRPDWTLPDAHPYGLISPGALEQKYGRGPSEDATDVLIPDRDTCRACHQGMDAKPPAVPSECVMCHPFHRPEHGLMRTSAVGPPGHRYHGIGLLPRRGAG